MRKTRKWTPLLTVVDRGFHSLVELLLRYDHAQWIWKGATGRPNGAAALTWQA